MNRDVRAAIFLGFWTTILLMLILASIHAG